ncbi:hypothetical protein FV217_07840 [Methylobacterium sp. WL9]|nr:hypothetical protein FV217_07840 [Methylobacterium sp. WL9]
MRSTLIVFLFLGLVGTASAQNEPITSPQDAACRDEARSRLFSAPNPEGLSLYNHGARLYRECMDRSRPPVRGRRNRQRQTQ